MVVASYLRDCGYKVLESVTPADVMTVLGSGQTIDVVLSEVRLRGKMDGIGLACWVREHHPGVDVILTSGAARAAEKAKDFCDGGPLRNVTNHRKLFDASTSFASDGEQRRRPKGI